MRYEEFIREIIEEFIADGKTKGLDFPNIDLYADQAAAFLNKRLDIFGKDSDKGKKEGVITKAMIGNYAKHGIIPHVTRKKYTQEHLLFLNMVYYLKGIFQMSEIAPLMKPLIQNYDSEFDEKIDLMAVCEIIANLQREDRETMEDRVWKDVQAIKTSLAESGMSDDDPLEIFMLIMDLAIKADTQRYLAKRLLDEYFAKSKDKKKE